MSENRVAAVLWSFVFWIILGFAWAVTQNVETLFRAASLCLLGSPCIIGIAIVVAYRKGRFKGWQEKQVRPFNGIDFDVFEQER